MGYNYYSEFQTVISSLAGLNTKVDNLYTIVIVFSVVVMSVLAFDIIKNWRFSKK